MKGVILAAGRGTRLYPVTKNIPKPLVPVAGKPTILYGLEQMQGMGIREVCIVVNPDLGDQIRDGVRALPTDVQLSYAIQEKPLGLAHAVAAARDFLGDSPFCLYLGDAIYDQSLAPFRKRFEDLRCDNLNLVQIVPDPERFGVAYVEGDRITKLVEKPKKPKSKLAMAGLYFFRPSLWEAIETLEPSARGEYEITDAIQGMVERGKDVRAAVFEGRWFDTGTLPSLLACSAALLGGASAVAPDASINGKIGPNVSVGRGARVSCDEIANSIVLDGADVEVPGAIRNALLGGHVRSDSPLENVVAYGDEIERIEV